jgi:hypothetical protein
MQLTLTLTSAVVATCTLLGAQAVQAQSHPPAVQRELNRLLTDCRSSGGAPTVNPGAVTRASLRDGEYSDYIVWSGEIDCAGAMTAFGGAAGQALVLIPGHGRGIRQVPAHSWKLIGDGPSAVEIIGGFDCAMGQYDRCTGRLKWNGRAFANLRSSDQQAAPVTTGASPRSIVGDWAENREGCASPMAGMVRIGAKSITSDEMSCTFSSVTRSGSTIQWAGTCNEGQGNRPARVTATETSGRLTISFGPGKSWQPLIRCPR